MSYRRPLPLLSAACALVIAAALPSAAEAGLFRAYLSINGNDANDCSLATPCRLLPAALAAVNDGGEIWMLNSGNFNAGPVIVDKSVTILAIPGAQGSLVVTTSRAIDVNGTGIRVTLRNIGFRDSNSTGYGAIYFIQGASLVVDNCRFANIAGGGLYASVGSLVVNDSVFRQNGAMGIDLSDTVDAVITNSEVVENGNHGVSIQGNAKVVVRNSVVTGNSGSGIFAQAYGAGTAQILVERSTVSGNFSSGLSIFATAAGGVIQAVATRSTFTGNGHSGIGADSVNGGTATVVVDGSTLAQQPRGVWMGAATVFTRQNNVFNYNTITDVDGGTLTAHPGI